MPSGENGEPPRLGGRNASTSDISSGSSRPTPTPASSEATMLDCGHKGIALTSSKLSSERCIDTDGREWSLDKLPVDEENADPDRLARLAIDCAKRVVLEVLDCSRMVFWLEGGAGVDCRGEEDGLKAD
jgi:hypothetical protein